MHRIKSAARKAAWKADTKWDEYNPFNRTVSRTTSRTLSGGPGYDVEAAAGNGRAAASSPGYNVDSVGRDREVPTEPYNDGTSTEEQNGTNVPSGSPTSYTDVESHSGAAADYYHPSVGGNSSQSDTLNGEAVSRTGSHSHKKTHGRSLDGVPEGKAVDGQEKPYPRNSDDIEAERKRRRDDAFKRKIPIWQQVRTVLFPRWITINWLILAAPVGIALHFTSVDPLAVFIVNFLAIIPLAGLLSFATEELALRVGEVLGGLLNASFGNAVELIVGIIALAKKEIIIVQTSLIGSMLSNLLLVMGMCFFFGGLQRIEQHFNMTVAQTAASILALAVGGILIPTAFTWGGGAANVDGNRDEKLSYGTAIILLIVYACYLLFQLKSHKEVYNAPSKKVEKRKGAKKSEGEALAAFAQVGHMGVGATAGQKIQQGAYHEPEEDEEEPQLTMIGALIALCAATALIGVCAEFLVDSINEVTCKYHVSQYFVGLILLPIVGNAAEHATAVTVAVKDKMDLAIGVAVGSSMQIALLVLPLMVILGWIIGADMTLVFDDFQIVVLFMAIVLVNYLIGDGKSHWLEGVLLMALYIIIAVASWFYPKEQPGTCSGT
ncbi:calcium/proton exchanger, variant 3 [Verruconis gallopava]|uniref:Calcium/proton exchanger, variant 2 n=1 Tax=Verruconis gallopava TaxID=253628 RepID=A0A0D2ARS8_9PEZI|nr:calcium/proton exchanger, variant 2 [Verruconis gallopava]XP_016211758.1 calcium/proton exchanger, variant 3 [Verruconis gallopava]KIW01888.1 calcium/proton exchanger, variant 2 [Verruconis gallopava]KIW01889.1 calcium/proton exchanger, variant 3 [Verruconis gallopava]